MRAREKLNKIKFYLHGAGGKRSKFEDHPSFFSLSGCSITVHLLDHRHFHILDVVVVGQIEVLGHGKTSSMVAGIMIISLHRPRVFTKTVRKFTAGLSNEYPVLFTSEQLERKWRPGLHPCVVKK